MGRKNQYEFIPRFSKFVLDVKVLNKCCFVSCSIVNKLKKTIWLLARHFILTMPKWRTCSSCSILLCRLLGATILFPLNNCLVFYLFVTILMILFQITTFLHKLYNFLSHLVNILWQVLLYWLSLLLVVVVDKSRHDVFGEHFQTRNLDKKPYVTMLLCSSELHRVLKTRKEMCIVENPCCSNWRQSPMRIE